MTASIPTLAASAAATKLPLDGKLSAARVVRTALGEMLTSPEAAGLSALAAGALVVLVRHAASREGLEATGSATPTKEAQAVLAMKGLSASDAELVLSALQMTGLMRVSGDAVSMPLLDEAVRAEASALRNRMAGWIKRGGRVPRPAPVLSVVAAPAVAPSAPVEPAPVEPAPAELASDHSLAEVRPDQSVARKSPRRVEAGVEYCRFTSTDKKITASVDDPVMVRIPCKGDSVAEITADYVADLQATFRSVDIEEELLKCRLWCESNSKLRKTFSGFRRFLNSWMTNAMRDSSVRNAVARNAQARNGFGQGGEYETSTTEVRAPAAAAPKVDDDHPAQGSLMDDFADLMPVSGSPDAPAVPMAAQPAKVEIVTATPAAVERAAPQPQEAAPREAPKPVSKAVLAARARLQSGAASAAGAAR